MNSAQRVLNISNLEEEAPLTLEKDSTIPSDFPSKGNIIFQDVHMQYRPNTPKVLNGLAI
jgi:ABC-type multidrug transport system fused ATPase/permease subunit